MPKKKSATSMKNGAESSKGANNTALYSAFQPACRQRKSSTKARLPASSSTDPNVTAYDPKPRCAGPPRQCDAAVRRKTRYPPSRSEDRSQVRLARCAVRRFGIGSGLSRAEGLLTPLRSRVKNRPSLDTKSIDHSSKRPGIGSWASRHGATKPAELDAWPASMIFGAALSALDGRDLV